MIRLKKEDFGATPVITRENAIFKKNVVVRRDFRGKILKPDDFKVYQDIVNAHRPYCASDFEELHFIPDL